MTTAQIRIGNFYIAGKHKKLSKKTVEKFKNTTTYFIFNEDNKNYTRSDYKTLLDEVWTFTPYEIIEEKDMYDIFKPGVAFARFISFSITRFGKYGASTSSYHVIDFSVIKKITKDKVKKGKRIFQWKDDRVAAIYFTPDISSRQQIVSGKDSISGNLMNYKLGYIKNYFQFINSSLEKKESFNMFDDSIDKEKIGELKNKTLYISENFIYSYSPHKIDEKDEQMTPEKLFEDYQYSYKVISDEELNNKILNNEDFYYLMYNQNVSVKVYSIVNGKTGDIIFSKYKSMSYNLKPKNLKEISKKISKN
ncbi:hypothetical protein [Kordia sp. SMS9]|uniref:hypothetical protein n=1 Tax=Kordia sp. SMS9 TaxID=2282170 RepID=UPI000E0D3A17|nr:hypothetical protein [Kordia sp. SMS9]